MVARLPYAHAHTQDLAGMAHDDIDPSVFSISGDDQKVRMTVYI